MVTQEAEFPADFAEKFGELFPEHDSVDDVLQYQEMVYQSLQASGLNNRSSSSNDYHQEFRHLGEGQSSNSGRSDSLLALDEAYARSLMMEEEFANVSIEGPEATEGGREVIGNVEDDSAETSVTAVDEDDINPDTMTYEDLQTLGESIGIESRGLSVKQVASLPSFRFKEKWGFFTPKRTNKECVICCMEYKDKEKLIGLPCKHDYHKDCIAKWLENHKTCPVCKKEVK